MERVTNLRPQAMAEIARGDLSAFWFDLFDLIDEVRRLHEPGMLVEEPELLVGRMEAGHVADAYLAAVAETLSLELGSEPPAWTRDPARVLPEPWFAHPGRRLRAILLAESPAPFRSRNLFVSANALSRA